MGKKIRNFFAGRAFIFFALIGLQAAFFVWIAYGLDRGGYIQGSFRGLSVLLALWVTTRDENAAYKISWIILILALPVFGICMYFFFSQRKLGPKHREKEAALIEMFRPYMMQDKKVMEELRETSMKGYRQSDCIWRERNFPVYRHTKTKYYPMGQYFFADLVEDLRKAKKYIFMEYFIVEEGIMLNTVLDILEQKVKEGLDVRFMYDDIGSMSKVPPKYYEKIRARGIQCQKFNPLKPILNSMFNNRDHRKITVIDGEVGYMSGANLADEYINAVERFGTWKDEAIRLQGDAVRSLNVIFLNAWYFTMEGGETDFAQTLPPFPEAGEEEESDGFVQPFTDSPIDRTFLSRDVFINMINRAEKYVYISTPYVDFGEVMLTALRTAAESGVDVRLTVPHIPDKKMVFLLTQSFFPSLIQSGVKIYEYTPGFIHSKTFVCDDEYGVIGTINLDFRSLYLHWEAGVWMWGSSALKELKEDYLETLKISQEVTYAMTQNKNVFVRFFQTILQVFGPLF